MRTYLASGYSVYVRGGTLTSESNATIDAMATRTTSSQGTEQFGLNLRANTSPVTFGADRVQIPDGTFSFGEPTADYNVVNEYKYVENEAVAGASSSSGQTDYTLSYIANVAPLTEAGFYEATHTIIVTSTF